MRPLRIAPVFCTLLIALGALGAAWPALADAEAVVVTNFPEVQQITGRVVVTEPIPQTRFETMKAVVAPGGRTEPSQWTEAGVVETQGFTHVTLSLAGNLQGSAQTGTVGVALVPDVPELMNALRTQGAAPFALQVEANVAAALGGFFSSPSATHRVGFPRYRVFLYNATSKSAETVVYAYLSGS